MPVTFNVRSDKRTPGVDHVADRAQRSDTGHVSGLSLTRERHVNEELKKALYSMEQMKEVMEENGEEHKTEMKRVIYLFFHIYICGSNEVERNVYSGAWRIPRMEDSFSRLLEQMKALYDGSLLLVTKLHKHLGEAFQTAFAVNNSQSPTAAPDALDTSFFEGISLEDILESFFDFGRNIYQELSSVTNQLPQTQQLCRDVRRRTSECWWLRARCEACQRPSLRECPGLGELWVKLSEVFHLLELSRQHCQEVRQIVQRHVVQMGGDASGGDTIVEVNIPNCPMLSLMVPSELELQDPAFIRYVAQEALAMYKKMVR
ncbi:clusterin-like protein 1 [Paramormyrops kingsleyae]|uniref:clusterin-like protein 1 n=1 Tax=Paramormyrops kingsleyae TaxID=1676925 RepID=UPI003B9718F2